MTDAFSCLADDPQMAFRIAFSLSLALSVSAICDNQRADLTLNCNSACQYVAKQSSSGCGVLWAEPCYQCCWNGCLTYTIEGGTCGTMHGTQEYEDCALGGSCLSGHCPFDPPSSGGSYGDAGGSYGDGGGGGGGFEASNGLGGGPIAGIVIGTICGVTLLSGIVRCLCKPKGASSAGQVELTPGSHL